MQGSQESPLPLVTLADYGLTDQDLLASLQEPNRPCSWCLEERGEAPNEKDSHGTCLRHYIFVLDQHRKRKAEQAAKDRS